MMQQHQLLGKKLMSNALFFLQKGQSAAQSLMCCSGGGGGGRVVLPGQPSGPFQTRLERLPGKHFALC